MLGHMKAMALAAVAIVGLGVIISLIALPSAHLRLLAAIGLTQADVEQREKKAREDRDRIEKDEHARVWNEVSPHHWRVVGWVLECTEIREISKLPHYLRPFFDPTYTDMTQLAVGPDRLPHHHEMALLQLSSAVGEHRVLLNAKVKQTYRFAQIATVATVILGLLTTILVAVSATKQGQEPGRWQPWIRVLAIIAPALGTAAATVVAFYSPQADWTQASRTLTGLTQLHNQIALDTWKLDCLEFENGRLKEKSQVNANIKQRFEEWTKRYYELQTASVSSGQADKSPGNPGSDGSKPPD